MTATRTATTVVVSRQKVDVKWASNVVGSTMETEENVKTGALSDGPVAGAGRPRILCAEDDRSVAAVVQEILSDEGYDVTCLFDITGSELRRVIAELEPACVLLDSSSRRDYGDSWAAAAWIRALARDVPVVMFSAHIADGREALARVSERAVDADFAAVLLKPFSIDDLLGAVSTAVARPRPPRTPPDAGEPPRS